MLIKIKDCTLNTFQRYILVSDGSSLRLGPGSARARHLEGLLELEFWRLDPSIGWVKPQAQALGLRLGLGSSSEFGGSTHH